MAPGIRVGVGGSGGQGVVGQAEVGVAVKVGVKVGPPGTP